MKDTTLTRADKERIQDSRLKLQSVADSLNQVKTGKIAGMHEIQECLDEAEKSLNGALHEAERDARQ